MTFIELKDIVYFWFILGLILIAVYSIAYVVLFLL